MFERLKNWLASKSLKDVPFKDFRSFTLCYLGALAYLVTILSGSLLLEHGRPYLATLDKNGLSVELIVVGIPFAIVGMIFIVSGACAKRFGEILYKRHLD